MEVQTFMLCKSIAKVGVGNEYDANSVGLHSFYSLDGKYPLEFEMPYFMLLRREYRGDENRVSLRFNIIDGDGNSVGEPKNVKAYGVFPAGHMFMVLVGKMKLSFPGIGDYRLDIMADEETKPFLFQYNVEITPPPKT